MKRQPVQSEEMPAFIGIDYHKAYSVYNVLDVQGESLGTGTYRSRSSGGFQRAGATMAGMPRCL
jgi:hypothetical protein